MIINPIVCLKCENELQPENVGVKTEGDKLIRVCGFCENEVEIK